LRGLRQATTKPTTPNGRKAQADRPPPLSIWLECESRGGAWYHCPFGKKDLNNYTERTVMLRCLPSPADMRVRNRGELAPYVDWVPYCPEMEIGLGTPREPIRLTADGRLVNRSGTADHTASMAALPLPAGLDGYVSHR
jgi:2-thiouracil desulfurase